MGVIECANVRVNTRYTLRDGQWVVTLRHTPTQHTFPSGDILLLRELFFERVYDPPDDVDDAIRCVGDRLRIVDLGANIGLATLFFLARYPNAEVTAVEPDAANAAILAKNIDVNRLGGRVDVIEACAAACDGSVRFQASSDVLSRRASVGEKGVEVPTIDVFRFLEHADLLKMDIEGGEWDILLDIRWLAIGVRAVVLEYHPEFCPDDDPARFASSRLADAGFTVLSARQDPRERSGTLWAIRA
jgi:FkbM family methyltransferase